MDLHKNWIDKKCNIYTWIKDSMENLLAIKIGRYQEYEEKASVLNFIKDILDEVFWSNTFEHNLFTMRCIATYYNNITELNCNRNVIGITM